MRAKYLYECRQSDSRMKGILRMFAALPFGAFLLAVYMFVQDKYAFGVISPSIVGMFVSLLFLSLIFLSAGLIRVQHVRLRAFPDYVEVNGGLWPVTLYNRLRIPAGDIVSIHAEVLVECDYFNETEVPSYLSPGVNGKGRWLGWQAVIVTEGEIASALAIITKDVKWLIGCNDPVQASEKLQEVYGVFDQPI